MVIALFSMYRLIFVVDPNQSEFMYYLVVGLFSVIPFTSFKSKGMPAGLTPLALVGGIVSTVYVVAGIVIGLLSLILPSAFMLGLFKLIPFLGAIFSISLIYSSDHYSSKLFGNSRTVNVYLAGLFVVAVAILLLKSTQ